MRLLPFAFLLALTVACGAQGVQVREMVKPPPTTLAGLQQLWGSEPHPPSGPWTRCELPGVGADTTQVSVFTLPDSSTIPLGPGWSQVTPRRGELERGEIWLAAPEDGRIQLHRERNGAHGRKHLMYRSGELPRGETCLVDHGQAGAIWTFYAPDPQRPDDPRPHSAFGDVMTPAGHWYSLQIWGISPDQRAKAASGVTALLMRQRPQ